MTPSTLRLRFRTENDLIFCEKVAGMNTHAADAGRTGLAELLSQETGALVHVAHRLDKGTSGAMVFAKTKEAAAELGTLFETHAVKKHYLFLTAAKSKVDAFEARSFISKNGNAFVSDPRSAKPNAVTKFKKLKTLRLGELWEAFPETGKPHQIRLHAAAQGLPVLGDAEHGGADFPRLCLHSKSLEFPWHGRPLKFEAATPAWVNDLAPGHAVLLDAVQSRSALFDLAGHESECLRLVHDESPCQIDQYGPQLVASWFGDKDPAAADLKVLEVLASTMKKPLFLRFMQNKGRDPGSKTTWNIGDVNERWTATENGVTFELRTDTGQSPGLFLDQRENRRWVRDHAQGRDVLNLFAYTGGFSVNAALGGAAGICTVDLSTKFNDWTGVNLRLNGFDPADSKFEFWSQDCLLFLKGAIKRQRKWDLIVCDPPSFGRTKDGVFQIQRQLPELLELMLACVNRGGKILLSTNYEPWSLADLQKQVFAYRLTHNIDIEPTPRQGLDFERPDEPPVMKSLLVVKK